MTTYDATHPKALAIYCSDGRFTQSVEDLLHELGHPRLDTLTVPGGPGLLNPWGASLLEADLIVRAAQFLIRGHAIDHVVLLAHAGCGYYRQKNPGRPAAEMKAQQIQDLEIATRALASTRPGLVIERFYARPEGSRVHFDRIASGVISTKGR